MTVHLLFDKLAYVDRLLAAGVDERQARAHADGLEQALREDVATKSDLAALGARMDARFAEVDARFAQIDARFDQMEAKFEARFQHMEAKFEARFVRIDARFEQMELENKARFAQLDAKFEARFDKMDAQIDTKLAALAGEIVKAQNRILMSLITVAFAVLGVALGAIKYLK